MSATIAVIAAIAEKKMFSDRSDQRKALSSDRSDNDRWDISILAIVVAEIAEMWFPYNRYDRCDRWSFFFLSDRRDRSEYMETRL